MQVKQAANVLTLLEYFAKRRRPATLAELADELGWPRSSAFNLIGTLASKGYLYEPRARGGYYPSPQWAATIAPIADADPLPEALLQLAKEVAQETGETTAIGACAGTHVMFVHVAESSQPIRYFAQVGSRVPIHASSAGRAILVQYSQQERQSIYRKIEFQRYTDTTPMSIDEVESEIRHSVERGYFQSHAEYLPDLVGVSLALPVQSRKLSIVVAGPISRCESRRLLTAEILQRGLRRFASDL
ncbi:IclR family transcriptional regulator [Bordetella tumulicola]|uniref:IclR family transcriptional regulator n=1 Tax=Bordetella tumulicola TaxID=1649133 RepID=UPI0039F0DFB8